MQSGVGDTGRHKYLTQLTNPTLQIVSIRQHITKKTLEITYLRPLKTSDILDVAIHLMALPSTRYRQTTLTTKSIEAFSMSATSGILELKR